MFRKTCLFLFVISCLAVDSYASLASFSVPFIKPCYSNDDQCILSSAQYAIPYLADGIPELGIPSGDPMVIKNITMDEGYVKLVLEDMKIYGAKQCKALNISRDSKNSTVQLTLDCPFEATGKYKFSGRLCFLDVNDEGDIKVKTDSVKTTITAKVKKTYGDDGKKHWKLVTYQYNYEPAEKFYMELSDLFKGNVAISDPFMSILGENWKEYVKQVGEPFAGSIVKFFYDVVKTLLMRVPTDQLEILK